MAAWSEKFNKMTQSALSKGKEVTEVTRLSVENTSLTQSLKEIATKIGQYVLDNNLFAEEEGLAALLEQANGIKATMEANQKKILDAKNIQICPSCGAEVSKSSKFCEKCGASLAKIAVQEEVVIEQESTEENA